MTTSEEKVHKEETKEYAIKVLVKQAGVAPEEAKKLLHKIHDLDDFVSLARHGKLDKVRAVIDEITTGK